MKTIVLLFHPDIKNSHVNKALVDGLDNDIKVRDMYKLYPDFKINTEKEKQVLSAADRVVLQFPMYWYGAPALVKQWEVDAWEIGWAYGIGGDALKGKELLIAVSPGADNYGHDKFAKYTVHELLRPFQATARLINMNYLVPFVTIGASHIDNVSLADQAKKYNEYLHQDHISVLSDFE
ncbi:putative NADPH-quinone reductase [Lactobacillus colini]|uniref:NADPH-quinone reductase n=1 Tax=Lactobacillus colini TaxID=1819254 RepID=A0ABS4ME96_9LACO|nr:NAD(P)H-dependent oxidoreductase [Lactobacillus colini]MBP2058012.1 putative NADPH-quinone reductase [Lactobacillus colini]